jgi:alpha-mannosidase
MASYAVDWETQTNLKDAFWLPGVGDHGGGPTRDMLQVAQRWQQSPFFPHLGFTTAHAYLQAISREGEQGREGEREINRELPPISSFCHHLIGEFLTPSPLHPLSPSSFPVWNDELYLEFHRGCYTTHADQKRWNRRCEGLLYQAELFASLATLTAGTSYPRIQLEDAWKKVLFNQFHDILPGTSIPEVFVEANEAWQEVERVGLKILDESLRAIASQITLPSPPQPDAQPIIVFNPLNWQRSELVAVSLPIATTAAWEIYGLSGEKISCQQNEESTLLFLAKDVPSVGYQVFWLCRCKREFPEGAKPCAPTVQENWVLENEWLRVVVDPNTGDLSRVFDKIYQREVLSGSGNQLQAFQDSGQYWDAWNIDPTYAQHPLPPTQLKSIEWLERGIVRSRLCVVRQIGRSLFKQEYILSAESPILKIATTVDWQEGHVLVKASFPLNLEASYATYEIPCGAIQRPTQPQTPAEQAKWEVPALRWADLSDDEHGVSLLNDCKYGYDAQPSQLRLTLLRSPSWPDPDCDRGVHQFTYALYPHRGSWHSADTVRRSYELNLPLLVLTNLPERETGRTALQSIGQLLNLQAENLVLMAFKKSENDSEPWILRCYECHGKSAELVLKSDLDLAIAHPIDLLERPTQTSEPLSDGQALRIPPWKIASFAVLPAAIREAIA